MFVVVKHFDPWSSLNWPPFERISGPRGVPPVAQPVHGLARVPSAPADGAAAIPARNTGVNAGPPLGERPAVIREARYGDQWHRAIHELAAFDRPSASEGER